MARTQVDPRTLSEKRRDAALAMHRQHDPKRTARRARIGSVRSLLRELDPNLAAHFDTLLATKEEPA